MIFVIPPSTPLISYLEHRPFSEWTRYFWKIIMKVVFKQVSSKKYDSQTFRKKRSYFFPELYFFTLNWKITLSSNQTCSRKAFFCKIFCMLPVDIYLLYPWKRPILNNTYQNMTAFHRRVGLGENSLVVMFWIMKIA